MLKSCETHENTANNRDDITAQTIVSLPDNVAGDNDIILVDEYDTEIGTAQKLFVHEQGMLHRAFSVVLYRTNTNGDTELLVTRRALGKYHSGGLWTNSCCSHPRPGEAIEQAVERRVQEELGCSIRNLTECGSFVYRAAFENGMIEHEYDHVFVAQCSSDLHPHADEVDAIRWMSPEEIAKEIATKPDQFTAWAPAVFACVLNDTQIT